MRPGCAILDDMRDDILAKITARPLCRGVPAQLVHQEPGLEHINAHRSERQIRLVGNTRRILGLFHEIDDLVASIHMHDAETHRFHARHFETANGHVCACVDMLAQHDFVIHLVNMIARQNDDIFCT